MTKKRSLFVLNLAIIFAGIPFLFWYYHIDGIYMNPTIEYKNGVDPANLKLEKRDYKRGEVVSFHTAFCKTRPAEASIQWVLSNGVLTIYPIRRNNSVTEGCYPEGEGTTLLRIEEIPNDAEFGCDHFFSATVSRDIGGERIITSGLQTEKFCVIP